MEASCPFVLLETKFPDEQPNFQETKSKTTNWDIFKTNDSVYLDELDSFLRDLCIEAAKKLQINLPKNPVVFVEHKEHTFTNKGYDHNLDIHRDSEEYPDTFTVIFYYQVDDGIVDGCINFYNGQKDSLQKIASHTPKSGDIIAFDDVLHQPGDYSSNSPEKKTRAFLSLFVSKTT